MTAPYPAIPRSVRELILILRDLARQTRTIKDIAARHHVPVAVVTALRDHYGPGPVELLTAAEELARRVKAPAAPPATPAKVAELVAEVCPPPKAPKPYRDGLTADERRSCRAWAESRGLLEPAKCPGVMMVKRAVVEAWRAEGCPDVSERALEPTPDAAAVATPDDGAVVDASVVCGTCGVPLPEPWGDSCPSCGTLFAPAVAGAPEQVKTAGNPESVDEQPVARDTRELDWHIQPKRPLACWDDWADLMARAESVRAVSMEWDAAIGAVEMLREALAEHEHRERLVQRVQDAIKPHLHLTINQVRLVLDAIEAS